MSLPNAPAPNQPALPGGDSPSGPLVNLPKDPVPPSAMCANDETLVAGKCVKKTANCDSYVEITATSFIVPARDAGRICYYRKMVNELSSRSSTTVPDVRNDIIARDHDGKTPHPRIMGSSSVNFAMLGEREVVLSGDPYGGNDIYVDNFVLLEVASSKDIKLWASGTADAPPVGGMLQVGGQAIADYHSYQQGGTSNFNAINLQSLFPLNQTLTLRASAMDCGGIAYTSNVYLLFQ
jgi:hypothetical protein